MEKLKRSCVLAWLFFAMAMPGLAKQGSGPAGAERHLRKGNEALKSGDWAQAEQEYRAALVLDGRRFEVHSNLGLSCYFQQKYDQAENSFSAALAINPDAFVPNFFLGIIYHRRGEFAKTLPLLSRAVKLKPDDPEARYWLGLNLANSGNHDAAASEIELAIKHGSRNVDSYYQLGKTYSKLAQRVVEKAVSVPVDGSLYRQLVLAKQAQLGGNWSLARRYYEAARKQSRVMRDIDLELGHISLATSEWEAAATAFQAELSLDSQSYRSHFGLAQAYLHLHQAKNGLVHMQHALDIRPEFFQPPPSIGLDLPPEKCVELLKLVQQERSQYGAAAALVSLWLAGRLQDEELSQSSLRDFEAQQRLLAARLGPAPLPTQAMPLKQKAESLFKHKRFEAAARAFAALRRLKPADPKVALLQAEALSEIGKHREARDAFGEYLRAFPADGYALFRLAQCHEKLSVEAFGQIPKIDANSYRNHQLLAESWLERSDWGAAVKEFQNALALKPNDSELYFGLGRAYLKAGKISAAAEQFQMALKLDPFDPSVTYSVGLCHYLNREPEKALAFLRKAASQDPSLLAAREQLGRVLVMQGQHAEAIPELEAAIAVDSDGSLHYLLYVCYRKFQKLDKAKAALEASERIRARNREVVESKVGERSARE